MSEPTAALAQPSFGAARLLPVHGERVLLYEAGDGPPLLYLHGLADVHTAVADWLPAHASLAAHRRLLAPAHPGCAASTGLGDVDALEDLVFHYLDLLDALELERVDVVGNCLGGWIGAELAVRRPDRLRRLVLIDAPGLYVAGAPIADVFMMAVRRDGADLSDLRALLFGDPRAPVAVELFPDDRVDTPTEVLRYQALSFAGRIGWTPPYLYDRKLRGHLRRVTCPTLVLWGARDRLVPLAHGEAYAAGIPDARLKVMADMGHSPLLEAPEAASDAVLAFLDQP
ncbi:MAG TPA: alpha/beta fold hydrolase [Chloroflexota bacterium]|nr:alpha/beta fold hydrolase [Chloroflexota bacterium]